LPKGRPTDYREEYCEEIIKIGREGYHVYEMAEYFDVNSDTLYEWEKVHPRFSDAFTRAREYSKAWMQRKVRNNLDNPNFQSKLVELNAKFLTDLNKIRKYQDAKTDMQKYDAVVEAGVMDEASPEKVKVITEALDRRVKMEQDAELRPIVEQLKEQFNENTKIK